MVQSPPEASEINPYPDVLVEGVIKMNLPVLGGMIHCYEQQIHSAFRRRDRISLSHWTAAWLASYFDILFAANRRFNPGEKRLLTPAQALPTMPGTGWSPMWTPPARELAALKAAWPITLRLCEHGWRTTYKTKGCSNSGSLQSELREMDRRQPQRLAASIPGDSRVRKSSGGFDHSPVVKPVL
jgi:hypothetical protein